MRVLRAKQLAVLSLLSAAVMAAGGCESTHQTTDTMSFDPSTLEIRDTRSRAVTENDLPPDVLDAVHDQFPGGTITRAEERNYMNGKHYYQVHVSTASGVERTMEYNAGPGR